MARFTNSVDWFELWYADCKGMIHTMHRNMVADLDAGYDPMGRCIKEQRTMISVYCERLENSLEMFKAMTDEQVNRWCFYDLKKRGVID